jgi:hypothetical protein
MMMEIMNWKYGTVEEFKQSKKAAKLAIGGW